jgi:hypothetical protein
MKWADWMPIKYSVLCEKHFTPDDYINPSSCNAPYFIILLCLTPDNFTHQEESGGT